MFLNFYNRKGFTLTEILVYVGLVAIIITIAIPFIFSIMKSYTRIRANQVVMSDAKIAMDYIVREIKLSREIYTPTSIFDTYPGQLSLTTKIGPPPDETQTYTDFYVDAGKLYLKREGEDAFAITSDRTTISNLVFKHFNPSGFSDSIQIQLTVDYNVPSGKAEFQASQSLTSSASLRGQY